MPPPAEISIPTTSTSPSTPSSKAYTLYNITLRLPLRSFVTQKRYSDFAALHAALTTAIGATPPKPLPGKSWFKSTISSPELTEARRTGLESYLKAIAESPDRRWRDTSAWRAFLNLPNSTTNSTASASGIESRVPAIGLAGVNAAAASDPGTWIDLHKEMKKALHDARLQLARRDAAVEGGTGSRNNNAGAEAGAASKRELIKAGSLLSALEEGILAMQENRKVGEGELRRRKDLITAARVERDGLEKLSTSLASGRASAPGREGVPSAGDTAALLGHGPSASTRRSGGRVLGAPLPETERTRELDNQGVVQLQKQMMDEQDQDVATLMKIVRRQKEMGLAIKAEVDLQDEMLDQLNDDADRVTRKVDIAKDRVRRIG